MKAGHCGPRIYNLFPTLLGPAEAWEEYLPRIAEMGFDWVFLNPFHYPGFSGSLYAVQDSYRLHPLARGDSDESADERLRRLLLQRGHDTHRLRAESTRAPTFPDRSKTEEGVMDQVAGIFMFYPSVGCSRRRPDAGSRIVRPPHRRVGRVRSVGPRHLARALGLI